jgi:hypothetical protein
MAHFFGYVDTSNNMYVIAGSGTVNYTHSFPQSWTRIPVKVKQAVISNEDYNSACDGYIDTSNRLYIWRDNQSPILVDTNVKQADSSEEGIICYVKMDNTLWLAHVKSSINKVQVASNVDYVVSANRQIAYKTLSGVGYFGYKDTNEDLSVSFVSAGQVKMVAVCGANSSQARYMYIDSSDRLLASPHNNKTVGNFSVIATNVASVKKGGWEYPFLTKDGKLYHVHQSGSPVLIASNVEDYWTNKTYGSGLDALFYTTKDNPSRLKSSNGASGGQGGTVSTALNHPTSIKTLGSTYWDTNPNTAPTQPGVFTEHPVANSVSMTGETVQLEWGTSTDPEGDSFTYALEFYNGSSWQVIASGLNVTSYNYTLPSVDASIAQFRVKAVDSSGAESSYRVSNAFKVRKYLLLIQDGDMVKTFKDGNWQTV